MGVDLNMCSRQTKKNKIIISVIFALLIIGVFFYLKFYLKKDQFEIPKIPDIQKVETPIGAVVDKSCERGSNTSTSLKGYNYNAVCLDEQTTQTTFHGKWVNYVEGNNWASIDTTIIKTPTHFEMLKAPFKADFPLRSTGIAHMVNDNKWNARDNVLITDPTLTMDIQALEVIDVKGKIVAGDLLVPSGLQKNINYVIYAGAYPEGDLIYYVDFSDMPRLQKLVKINSKPTKKQYTFELTYSDKVDFTQKNKKTSTTTNLIITKEETLRKKESLIALKNGSTIRGIGVNPFQIWDSNMGWVNRDLGIKRNIEEVDTTIKPTRGGYVLMKDVSKFFLKSKIVYPVYSDAEFFPDPNIESTSVDGWAEANAGSASWETTRDHAGTGAIDNQVTANQLGSGITGTHKFNNARGFYLFDTSSIDDGDVVSACTISLEATAINDEDNDAQAYMTIGKSNPASNTAIVGGDYNEIEGTDDNIPLTADQPMKKLTDDLDLSGLSTGSYTVWTCNSDGIANVNITGVSDFALLEGHEIEDIPIVTSGSDPTRSSFSSRMAETSGTSSDPLLTVTSAPASGGALPDNTYFDLLES